MKSEDTLQFLADFHSKLCPTRKHALNYLFNTIGNGYEWIKGELVDPDGKFEKRYRLRKSAKKAEFEGEDYWWKMNQFFKDFENAGMKIQSNYIFKWDIPNKEYSKIYNYPENIAPDWLALLEECKRLMKEDGIEVE